MLVVLPPREWPIQTWVSNVEIGRDISGEVVVTEHDDAIADGVAMARDLSLGQHYDATQGLNNPTGRTCIGDALDEQVTLRELLRTARVDTRQHSSAAHK